MFLHEEHIFEDNKCDYRRIFLCRRNTSHFDSVVDTQLFVDRFKENMHFVHEDSQLFGEEPYDSLFKENKLFMNISKLLKKT